MIVTPLIRFFSDKAESMYKRTPHPTVETSEKQGLVFIHVIKTTLSILDNSRYVCPFIGISKISSNFIIQLTAVNKLAIASVKREQF